MAIYSERTHHSQIATDRARKVMPAGVPSSFQAYDPWPVVVKHAAGSKMIDVDDNEYVDYDMGFGALFAGHMNPAVRRAVVEQLDHGTLYVTPCELNAEVGELLAERYGLPMWRPDQLGHRGHAGRDPSRARRHRARADRQGRGRLPRPPRRGDGLQQATARPRRPGRRDRIRCRSRSGITKGTLDDVIVIPYNDPDALERALSGGDVACFIVEPVMENIGICLPIDGYLQAVREICDRHGTLLIFDEVKTGITAGYGGATSAARRATRPGHARQVDRRRLPGRCVRRQGRVHGPHHRRQGAAPRHLQRQPARDGGRQGHPDRGVHPRRSSTRRSPATTVSSTRARRSSTARASRPTPSQFGAKGCITWLDRPVRNYRDYKATDFDLAFAQWIHGINRGVLLPPGLDEQWLISVMHDDDRRHEVRRRVRGVRRRTHELTSGCRSSSVAMRAARTIAQFVERSDAERSSGSGMTAPAWP